MINNVKVTVANTPRVITVSTGNINSLSKLTDVSIPPAGPSAGALLQYDITTGAWTSTNIIESGITINCGYY
jgi:hypothetical protein